MSPKHYKFKASILQNGNMNAAYVEFPFSVEDEFGKKGQVKVKVLLDKKVEYRGSLAKMGYNCHILGLTQAIRKQLNKSFDDEVNVELWEDFEERIVEIPEDVQFLFTENIDAFSKYKKLSYTHRKEYMQWIEEAKKEETREKRKIKMIEMLLAK